MNSVVFCKFFVFESPDFLKDRLDKTTVENIFGCKLFFLTGEKFLKQKVEKLNLRSVFIFEKRWNL
ncbi:hypothetical protein [Leptospira kirschneri]|uniref:hypothetical protein n=1 Tax=Leptospira kirschneri TaxID=29507 RepID=UPI0002979C8E|nr:hypothetical protein [Leptospira kirschneri]EKP06224.1 hypothetical protein LEP1GSC018_1849 [Leptospira kirschneri str. 2008720114]UML82139.1 hypothetical protein FH602_04575 [Leptospira kirschneri]